MGYRGRGARERTYSDKDGLHALGAGETYVAAYQAVAAIRWHGRARLLLAQRDGDEAIFPHENARGRPPAQARRGREDAFGGSRDDGIGRNGRRRGVRWGLDAFEQHHLVHAWGLRRVVVVEESGHGGWKGGVRECGRSGHPGGDGLG